MFQVSRSCGTPPGAYTPGSGLQHHNHHIALQSAYNSFPTRFSRNRGIQLTSNAFSTQTRHSAQFQRILHAKAASSSLATRFARNCGIQLTCNIFSTQARHLAHFQRILHAKAASSSLPMHFARKSSIQLTSNTFCTSCEICGRRMYCLAAILPFM